MKSKLFLAMWVFTVALSAVISEAAADQVPRDKQGIWSTGSCGEDDYTLLVGPDRVMILNGDNGGYGPEVGGARFAVDTIVMFTQGSAHILPPLDDLTRCAGMAQALEETYREEISAFRIVYTPPDFGEEEIKVTRGVQAYRFAMKEDRPQVARQGYQSAQDHIRAVAEAKGVLATRIWWGMNHPLGISIEGVSVLVK